MERRRETKMKDGRAEGDDGYMGNFDAGLVSMLLLDCEHNPLVDHYLWLAGFKITLCYHWFLSHNHFPHAFYHCIKA